MVRRLAKHIWQWLVEKLDRSVRFAGRLLVLGFLLMCMDIGWRHMRYLFADEPQLVTAQEATVQWRADAPFHVRLPLDWNHAVRHVSSHHDYTLVPVAGTGARLVTVFPGRPEPKTLGRVPELYGRIIGAGWFGDWDAGEIDTEIQLQDEFASIGVKAPPNALLMVPGWHFTLDEYWQIFLGLAAVVVILLSIVGGLLRWLFRVDGERRV